MLSEWAYQNESKVQWLTDLGRQIYNFHLDKVQEFQMWLFLTLSNVEFSPKTKIQDLQNDQNGSFISAKIAKFDFTYIV